MFNSNFNKTHRLFMAIFVLFMTLSVVGQDDVKHRVMFYNVENLFDTKDDSLTNDNEFLPDGERHWNNTKFYKKLNNIYKVILGVGEWELPAIVGLCEVENRFVLNQLVYETPLKKFNYKIIHFDSPDRRGIDVGLLYRKDVFLKDTIFPIPVNFPFEPDSKTRDILYVKGSFGNDDTIHFFVNHWPSRYGGYMQTFGKRNYVAKVLKHASDSILEINPNAKIIMMGDLNDGPGEESLQVHLNAIADTIQVAENQLINLLAIDSKAATLKYQGNWDLFDQLIVSGAMLTPGAGYKVLGNRAFIYKPDYLMETDEKYLGEKPYRTYNGYKYIDGYSDHLPVYLDVIYRE